MRVKTADLIGPALDWAVAKCERYPMGIWYDEDELPMRRDDDVPEWLPSTDWIQGGPIIEREEIELHVIPNIRVPGNWADCKPEDVWCANIWPAEQDLIRIAGPTPLIAAMRCYVASKLGDEVDVPGELT